jgi:hypothetical protein
MLEYGLGGTPLFDKRGFETQRMQTAAVSEPQTDVQ